MLVRTTVRLDPDLIAEAKRVARSSGRTLSSVIEEALRTSLAERAASNGKLPTFRGQGLRPGVDLNDSAALLDLMETNRSSNRQRSNLRSPRRRG